MNDKLSDIGHGANPLEATKAVGNDKDYFAHRKPGAELAFPLGGMTASGLAAHRPILSEETIAAVAAAMEPIVEEPVFVLRAQDMFAPGIVEEWARRAEDMHINGRKVRGAREIAARMREWPNRKMPD